MKQRNMINSKAFTLIELLIAIAIITILATTVIIVVNPGEQLAKARDATRERHLNSLEQALYTYEIDNHGIFPGGISTILTEICNTNVEEPSCEGLINLSDLGLATIPMDPRGGIDENGTGYMVSLIDNKILVYSPKRETTLLAGGGDSVYIFNDGEQNYRVHVFSRVGEYSFYVPEGLIEVDVLVVAGGGSGASTFTEHKGGGGGAGGVVFKNNYLISSALYPIIIGAGGEAREDSEATGVKVPGFNGENSSFGEFVALGGGGGRRANSAAAQSGDGGSGGGGHYNAAGGSELQSGSLTGGYGNPGGTKVSSDSGYGGGGAGSAGRNDSHTPNDGRVQLGRWAGGQGIYEVTISEINYNFKNIFGNPGVGEEVEDNLWFAGGGGSGINGTGDNSYGAGGYGGGGRGAYVNQGNSGEWGVGSAKGEDGKENTGGGGGGARGGESGAGGSGVIIVRYKL